MPGIDNPPIVGQDRFESINRVSITPLEVMTVGFCVNKKVLAGLAVVALATLVAAPNLFLSLLPLLLLTACPLSMLFMGRAMMGGHREAVSEQTAPRDLDPAPGRGTTLQS